MFVAVIPVPSKDLVEQLDPFCLGNWVLEHVQTTEVERDLYLLILSAAILCQGALSPTSVLEKSLGTPPLLPDRG